MKWLYLVLLLAACGPPPDYVSNRGISYYWQGASWDTNLIEEQEDWLFTRLPPDLADKPVESELGHVRVLVYPDMLRCSSGDCWGRQDYSVLHVTARDCPFNSALSHEIGHWMQFFFLKKTEYLHESTNYWYIVDSSPRECP